MRVPVGWALRLLLSWLLTALAVGLFMFAVDRDEQRTAQALVDHGLVVTAVVTGTAPSDHNTVFYAFTVNGTRYATSDRSDAPNPEARDLRVGDPLHVVYDARDPNVSRAGDPRDTLKQGRPVSRVIIGLYGGLVGPVVLTAARYRKRAASSPGER